MEGQEAYIIFTIGFIYSLITARTVECASNNGESDKHPKYMDIFSTHQHWEGTYIYNSSMHYCYMYAHSEHYLKKDLLLVTFRDREGVTIELEGLSPGQNELEVKFSVHVLFHHADRFPVNFTLQGLLSQDTQHNWLFNADITPKGKFGHFTFQQSDNVLGPAPVKNDSKGWKYFAIIGIPVILSVVGVAGTVALIYWAIKKGYIRHVPKSYDTFHNPTRFENNPDSTEGGNVHI